MLRQFVARQFVVGRADGEPAGALFHGLRRLLARLCRRP